MKVGVGGGVGPVRAGVSNRGFGVGLGPFSAGSGWGRRGGTSAGGALLAVAFLVVTALLLVGFLLVWPFMLGTWAAQQLGAAPDSPLWVASGVTPEVLYIVGAVILARRRAASKARAGEDLSDQGMMPVITRAVLWLESLRRTLRDSLWILPTFLLPSVGTCAAFLILAGKTRNRKWATWSLAWAVWAVGIVVVAIATNDGNPTRSSAEAARAAAVWIMWAAGVIHVLLVNRIHLRSTVRQP